MSLLWSCLWGNLPERGFPVINPVKKKCLTCGYERQPEDESEFTHAPECPKCHAIYEKVDRLLLKKEYEKAEEWLNKKQRGKPLLKTGQQSPEETGLKSEDYNNSNTLKLGKLSIGLNPKKKTMIVTGISLIAFTIFSFAYNQKGIAMLSGYLYHIFQHNAGEKLTEYLPQAKSEAMENLISDYERFKNSEIRGWRESAEKKMAAGPTLEDIQATKAYREFTWLVYMPEEKKYNNRYEASVTIGEYLRYISYLTGPLGLIFLLAGLIKSDNFTPI